MMSDEITAAVDVPTKHVLVWVPEENVDQVEGAIKATTESLAKARFKHEDWLYDRFNAYLSDLGYNWGAASFDHLRQFVQMITHYDFMMTVEEERLQEIDWINHVIKKDM